MKIKLTWPNLMKATALLLGVILLGYLFLRPFVLTQTYGPELKQPLQKYIEVLGTIQGRTDSTIMAQVATGKTLYALTQYDWAKFPSLIVITKADVKITQVVEYSSTNSEVIARIEEGWYKASPATGAALDKCHADAYTDYFVLVREDGVWKVTDEKSIDMNIVDDSPELLAKYCGSN